MFDRKGACKTFFGVPRLGKIVVVTPLSLIYKKLFYNSRIIRKTSGWWNHKEISLDKKKLSIVKIPQGESIVDLINCTTQTKLMILVGFCGGNPMKTEIGDLICPNEVISREAGYHKIKTKNLGNEIVLFTRNFSEQGRETITFMKKNEISGIEMESYLLFKHCKKRKIKPYALLIVSDLVNKIPFYKMTLAQSKKIWGKFKLVEDKIKDEIGRKI